MKTLVIIVCLLCLPIGAAPRPQRLADRVANPEVKAKVEEYDLALIRSSGAREEP
jgi:hypothetical protein